MQIVAWQPRLPYARLTWARCTVSLISVSVLPSELHLQEARTSQVWYHSWNPSTQRLRQEDCTFDASLPI